MRENVILAAKREIEGLLQKHIRDEREGRSCAEAPSVTFDMVEDLPVTDSLLWEIRIVLGVLGRPPECCELVDRIYAALQQHHLNQSELRVVLMSLHVSACKLARMRIMKRATIRYIIEETGEKPYEEVESEIAAT